MPTSIDSNPFPLGKVAPQPNHPASLLANVPDFDCDFANLILLQADDGNLGRCFFGNKRLNVSRGEGLIYTLSPGDVFVLSGGFMQNVYRFSEFLLDCETPGDGVWVSCYIR